MQNGTVGSGFFGDAALNVRPDGLISYWSEGASRLLGYTATETVGYSLFERLIPSEQGVALRKYINSAKMPLDGVRIDCFCQHRDNRRFEISVAVAPIVGDEGALAGFTLVLENTALRKGHEARLLAIIETMPTGVLVVDETGKVDLVNRHFEYLSGYKRGELDGMTVDQLVPEAHRDAHDDNRALYHQNSVPRVMGNGRDLMLCRADGRQVPVEIGLSPITAPSGDQVLALVTDISQRVEIERRTNRQKAELARTVEELSTFAYVASHDLKSPLRGISQISHWIEEDIDDRDVVVGHLKMLRSRIERMERLLNDLLAYSRAGRVAGKRDTVNKELVASDIFKLLAPPEGMSLRLEGENATFETLRTPFEQVVQNLFSNAIKHHDHPSDGTITFDCRRVSPDFFEFVVSDDGPGIAPEYRERVFRMFQTLRPRDEVEGSGIGLALVRKIVETYGGKVWVGSHDEQGCAIHFLWPVVIERGEDNEQ